eukprot:NODE_14490_length_445_cov_87.239130_g14191_i0.p1 GENE.NODE_14490_length_445_cov_87.239130_g14191_i0~~NODE_14490_length_445_cov_87.239130_g14191_i0.p1  ORF type:complete len:109 (+),score=4.78 NODE_14490_length_445_cov_87.239130_g14191_i0:70-396(+)
MSALLRAAWLGDINSVRMILQQQSDPDKLDVFRLALNSAPGAQAGTIILNRQLWMPVAVLRGLLRHDLVSTNSDLIPPDRAMQRLIRNVMHPCVTCLDVSGLVLRYVV